MGATRFSTQDIERFLPITQPAFVAWPIAVVAVYSGSAVETVREIYRVAYERAQEINRPSRWAPLYLPCEN